MQILRVIFWLSVAFNIHLVGVYLPGKNNVLEDTLSRVAYADGLPVLHRWPRGVGDWTSEQQR